jgi:hypothetical protein
MKNTSTRLRPGSGTIGPAQSARFAPQGRSGQLVELRAAAQAASFGRNSMNYEGAPLESTKSPLSTVPLAASRLVAAKPSIC